MSRRRLPSPALLPACVGLVLAAACLRPQPPQTAPAPPPAPPPEAARPAPEAPPAVATPSAPLPPLPAPQRPAPPTAGALVEGPPAPILLRAGLASDLARVVLPCCGGGLVAEAGGRQVAMTSPLAVTPGGAVVRRGSFRLQAAALRDEAQAAGLARRLEKSTGQPADSHFDAAVGLYRVRVGRFATRAEAEATRDRLAGLGLAGAWIVSEGGGLDNPSLRLTQGGQEVTVPGRWLAVRNDGDAEAGIRVQTGRYRGRILVYLNDRGSLNLINELDLEDYLRGVVPAEMGPELYGRLEALKAQAVAARTYTLRNLGEFDNEGYDICATPRCQVYRGMAVEHPLSDRAVAETAGQVLLYRGELVDARYSATCGGHTEDVETVFPLEDAPYLRGVPCLEAGVDRLRGALPRGAPYPAALTRRLFPGLAGATPAEDLAARLRGLARAAGLPVPSDRLASLERSEVQRFVASLFDLALDARLFVAPEDLPYLVDEPPADWSEEDRRRAAYLLRSGLLTGSPESALGEAEQENLVLRLAELLRLVDEEEGHFRSLAGRSLVLRDGSADRTLELPPELPTFRRRGEALVAADLALVPGDGLTVVRRGGELAALLQQVDPDGVAYDRSSRWSSWTRFRSDRRLAELVEERYPGLGFSAIEVLSRGVSGRVGRLLVRGTGGRTVEVEGLAVRWTLDVPDTRFTVKRLTPERGEPGYLFTGSGWGHGVGLCQVGAYGMAGRHHAYREILQHYYSGVTLARVQARVPRWSR